MSAEAFRLFGALREYCRVAQPGHKPARIKIYFHDGAHSQVLPPKTESYTDTELAILAVLSEASDPLQAKEILKLLDERLGDDAPSDSAVTKALASLSAQRKEIRCIPSKGYTLS